MPLRKPFDAAKHDQYMTARDHLGMALADFRTAKNMCTPFVDPRAMVLTDMFLADVTKTLQRAQALQSGVQGEEALVKGTKTKTERLIITIENCQKFSLGGLFEPQKEEEVSKFNKKIEEAHKHLLDAVSTLEKL